jgi:hypothetical protein
MSDPASQPAPIPAPGPIPQKVEPAKPFNPASYVAQAASKQVQVQAESRKKEEEAQARDTEKFSGNVGKTYSPINPGESSFLKILAFQVRVNLGPGMFLPAYLIERINPHSSWWVGCEAFLNQNQEAQLPGVVARRIS